MRYWPGDRCTRRHSNRWSIHGGETLVDFGNATIRQGGLELKVALYVMTLRYMGAIFIQAFSQECTETFLEGHRRAFEFFGGVPYRISYDSSANAVPPVCPLWK